MSDRQSQPFKKKRSGSERRERDCIIKFRGKPDERAAIKASAAAAGLSVGSFLRSLALDAPRTRAVRTRPTPDMERIKSYDARLGRVEGNLYQLVRGMNVGKIVRVDEMYDAAKEAGALVAELRQAFGFKTT